MSTWTGENVIQSFWSSHHISHKIKGKVLDFILWCSTAFCPSDGIKLKKREWESWWQTQRSELKWKGHVPQWWRSVLPWSPAWPVPQPAPLVAGAINEDQKQNTIICFLVGQRIAFPNRPSNFNYMQKQDLGGLHISKKNPRWWMTKCVGCMRVHNAEK